MKEVQLHLYFPFSYWQTTDLTTGARLERPTPDGVLSYLQSLACELASMKEDDSDCTVTAIRFLGGYLGLLDAAQFEHLLALIHRVFSVRKDCPIGGIFFPGSLDMEKISVYRNRHVAPFLFEVPSLLFRECERLGYPVTLQALDKTAYFLQNFGVGDFGLRLPTGIGGRTENMWKSILGQIYHYHPMHVQFYSLDPSCREHPAFEEVCGELAAHGYRRIAPLTFTAAKETPLLLTEPDEAAEAIGAGLGAITRIDGYEARNTTDRERYRLGCKDYRNLIETVREI